MLARAKVTTAFIVAALLGLGLGLQGRPSVPELIFMDVGQGDCTVLRVGADAILIDAGPKSPSFDAGERIVVPNLRAWGLQPRVIFLTHPDIDHVGGMKALHKSFPSARVAVSEAFRTSDRMVEHLQEAGIEEADVIWLPHQSKASFGPLQMQISCPELLEGEGDNEGSIVMRITDGPASAMLMGDAGFSVENRLLVNGGWASQILKVGHHGSRSSSSSPWLRAVSPKWSVISCGLNNHYGHPHKTTLQRLAAAQTTALRTDERGDIRFREGASGFELEAASP